MISNDEGTWRVAYYPQIGDVVYEERDFSCGPLIVINETYDTKEFPQLHLLDLRDNRKHIVSYSYRLFCVTVP